MFYTREELKNKEIKKGNIIVLTAIGSGWTWGSTVLKWTM
jgi:3-oxoacyl-[acyl-carrier-protein] synthase III